MDFGSEKHDSVRLKITVDGFFAFSREEFNSIELELNKAIAHALELGTDITRLNSITIEEVK